MSRYLRTDIKKFHNNFIIVLIRLEFYEVYDYVWDLCINEENC